MAPDWKIQWLNSIWAKQNTKYWVSTDVAATHNMIQSIAIGKSTLYDHISHHPMSLYTKENE
jgi:hypothetical protein